MKKAQILIAFDDGIADHADAATCLSIRGLFGCFGLVTSKIDHVGFLTIDVLSYMRKLGHFICNHSAEHKWLGQGPDKPGLAKCPRQEVTDDYLAGKAWLDSHGFHGDYLFLPFGTANVDGDLHIAELLKHFKWIRLTMGAPLPPEHGLWTPAGGKRLYPSNYNGPLIGLTEVADVRRPNGIKDAVDNAIGVRGLAVVLYHTVCHVVGETQMITWERFLSDIDYIDDKVKRGLLESVTPVALMTEKITERTA
jgi:hypothetical protein